MLCLRIWILGPSETQNLGRQGLTKPYEDHFSHIFSQRERGILIHHLTPKAGHLELGQRQVEKLTQ
jgi:hypothetical protein